MTVAGGEEEYIFTQDFTKEPDQPLGKLLRDVMNASKRTKTGIFRSVVHRLDDFFIPSKYRISESEHLQRSQALLRVCYFTLIIALTLVFYNAFIRGSFSDFSNQARFIILSLVVNPFVLKFTRSIEVCSESGY